MDQKLLDEALTKALEQLELKENIEKLKRLKNRKVSVQVAVMAGGCLGSDTAELIRAALIQRLILHQIKVVNGTSLKPEFRLNVLVHVFGVDVGLDAFPHYYLPLYYHYHFTAHAKLTLNAYNLEDFLPEPHLELTDDAEFSVTRLFWIIKW
ncbi:MAG: hypothetical protein ACYS8W_21310 [Planctomycetota bacterium]|jgi:hypothetical protein